MTAHPPPGNQHSRPKRKVAIIVLLTFCLVLSVPCCGGAAYFAWQAWKTGADSPDAAVTEFFQGLKYNDLDRFENSLCSEDRASADKLLTGFNESLKDSGFELQGITWERPSIVESDNASKIEYTMTTSRDGRRYKIQRLTTMKSVEERGWRVCDVGTLGL
ncbi:hypothetical protein [Cryptosporangium minutisporangium]|uniref:DUF4878 domain-containing protein n=1 Tax=Cryptosporangium minutisporangium TaxID=113569 RepID=A0ABP6SQX3_9ACTN